MRRCKACPSYKTKVVVLHGHHDLCSYIGESGSVLSHIGSLVEDLGNRRVREDLMAELIERHALSDRQNADGDDLGCGITIDLHPEDLLRLGMVKDLEESGGALILGYLVHDRRLRPDGIDRDCLSLYIDEVKELLYGVDFIGFL